MIADWHEQAIEEGLRAAREQSFVEHRLSLERAGFERYPPPAKIALKPSR